MSPRRMHRVLLQLRQAAQYGDGSGMSDAELLRLFIDERSETAFAALVRRHAAMVLGVCKRVTGDEHDADDAFQAAFCVLLRKAGSIRRREVLGSWLYGVAYRTALAARVRRARTRRREHQVVVMPQPLTTPPEHTHDWQPLLDAALDRLSETYRAPIILCDLEGKSRKEAARMLGLAEGTLSSRLARGRRLLAQRLQRQGLALSGGALAAFMSQQTAVAQVPNVLLQAVTQAGAEVLAGQAPAALAFSSQVLALSEVVMKTILLGKLKTLTLTLMACATLALAGYWALGGQLVTPPAAAPADEPAAANLPAASPNAPFVEIEHDQPQYRIETALQLPDAVLKPMAAGPAVTVPLGQRASVKIEVLVNPGGEEKSRPASVHWHVQIVRERGQDALVNITVERKDRRANGTVRGQSLEFEDFVPLNAWKEINDPALGGMTFKFLVSQPKVAAQQPVPQAAQSPKSAAKMTDLTGVWQGPGWGTVRLQRDGADGFAGTYTDTYGQTPGKIKVRWSSAAGQFEGTWGEGTLRFGQIALRLSADTIRGAFSADPKCTHQPGVPSLADLTLRRVRADAIDLDGDGWPDILIAGGKPQAPTRNATPGATNAQDFTVFKLQHIKATTVAKTLKELFAGPGARLSIAADEPTNTVLIRASRLDQETIAALLQKLDVPSSPPDGASNSTLAPDNIVRLPGISVNQAALAAQSAALSPDGARLAIGQKDDVIIFDTKTGKTLSRTASSDAVKSLAFSPDGKLLASASGKGDVRFLDAATGKEVRRIDTAQKLIRIEFAVDGPTKLTVLIVTTPEPAVRVWDLNTGKLLRVEPKMPPAGDPDAKPNTPGGAVKPPPVRFNGKIEVIHAQDAHLVQISIGSDQGLKKNDTLEVFRLSDQPMYLGKLRIVEVQPQQAVGRLDGFGPGSQPVRVGDRVTNSLQRN